VATNGHALALGGRIRELRRGRELSLARVAEACGISSSLLSQVERGVVSPSLQTLHAIGQFFGVPMFAFFGEGEPREAVVRRAERRRLAFPASQVTYELVTPDLQRQLEVLEMGLDAGQETFDCGLSHAGEECVVVLEGTVTAYVGERVYDLGEGDSVYLDASVPHRYKNRTKRPARLLSVITPPSF
jgi:transcriptional regulator with XRE-family HTH domain